MIIIPLFQQLQYSRANGGPRHHHHQAQRMDSLSPILDVPSADEKSDYGSTPKRTAKVSASQCKASSSF